MKKIVFNFERGLFVSIFTVVSLGLIFYAVTSLIVIQKVLKDSFVEKSQTAQTIFTDSINNDILTGLYPEVYRRCKLFYEYGNVKSILIKTVSGRVICDLSDDNIDDLNTNTMESQIYFSPDKKAAAATVSIRYSNSAMQDILKQSLFVLILAIILSALGLIYIIKKLSHYFGSPVRELSEILSSGNLEVISNRLGKIRSGFDDIQILNQSVGEMAHKLAEAQSKIVEKTIMETMSQVSAQVAHDIRSPLAALNVLIRSIDKIPERQRIMMRNATQRINDIANNLLGRYRQSKSQLEPNVTHEPLSSELISNLLDHIVSEKRVQYADKPISLSLHVEENAFGVFSKVSAGGFKRVMSNLINNAVEAVSLYGIISVHLAREQNHLNIEVRDNGCGMSEELQTRVFMGGISIGKKEGTGLGLMSSQAMVNSWKGSIYLESVLNQGTTVTIKLPLSDPAPWFLKELVLYPGQTVVVLDDSQSIHDIWNSRFEHELPNNIYLQVKHYFQPQLLIEDFKKFDDRALFLMDYELDKTGLTGIDVIKVLDIANRSILVTSHDEEVDLRIQCKDLGIKILPKTEATHVPIIVMPELDQGSPVL